MPYKTSDTMYTEL